MTKYSFRAIDADGATVKGVQSGDDVRSVHEALRARDLHPIEVREKGSLLKLEITKKKIKRKEVMHLSRQLAVFVRAGIPIIDGLDSIGEETPNKVLRDILDSMAVALRAGSTFAEAAEEHRNAFPDFYISLLRSAELTGRLDQVLEQLADYIERDLDARSKVTSAMTYPAVVLGMAIVTTLVLTIFVLPRFETFFASLDAKLPLATRIMLAISGFTGHWGWLIALVIVGLIVGFFLGKRTTRGHNALDRTMLKIPVVGDLVRHAILERFCRVLASMVTAGVPLPDALAVAGSVTNNVVYRNALVETREATLRGEGLATPLAETHLFPGAARQMFRVGEDTGTLDQQLGAAAKYFDRELDLKIKRFTGLFEPAVIIFIGVVVGFVAVAMVSAMYGIFNQSQGM
jgi:type IV pilus assembly protein PilC